MLFFLCVCLYACKQKARDNRGGHKVEQKTFITGPCYNECFKRVVSALLMSMSNKSASG